MKKIITVLTALVILISLCPCTLAEADNGILVSAEGLTFTGENGSSVADLSLAGKEINISAKLKSISGEGKQKFAFFVTVMKKGKYYSSDMVKGELTGSEEFPVALKTSLPEDKTGVTVETYIWDSVLSGNALAPKGVFGSDKTELIGIYADGRLLSDMGGDDSEGEIVFPASRSRAPEISAVARDMSAKIEIDEVVSIPQDVKIKVTSAGGAEKVYTLSLKLEDGEISNAYLLDKDGNQNALKKDVLRLPDYGNGLKPGDAGFDLITAVPESCTYVYNDRTNLYYYDIPENLIGKTVLQASRQLLAYDEKHIDKNNGKAIMGGFDINRSANIYVYGVNENTDWIVSEGYKRAPDSFKLSRTQSTAAAYFPEVFVKTVMVNEGETVRVNLGNATSTAGVNSCYHILVDFLSPSEVAGIRNVTVEGVDSFVFDPDKEVYEIDLFGDNPEIPDISYEVYGLGAYATYTPCTSVPGTSEIKVATKDGKYEKTYRFNIHKFENVLREIRVGGEVISDFDKNIHDYTFVLPYGDNSLREVTATAGEGITVDIAQATEENKTATITLTDLYGNQAVYTVTFELTLVRPSSEKVLACSWTGIFNGAFSVDHLINYSNPADNHILNTITANHSVYATNNESVYKNTVLYNRIDLTKLTDIDLTKPVYYKLYTNLGSDAISNVTSDIELYLADNNVWDVLNGADRSAAALKATDMTQFTDANLIGTLPITMTGGLWGATGATHYVFDIADEVREALENGDTNLTVAIKLNPVESQTKYLMRLRIWQNSSTQSNITYYKYD